MMLAIACGLRHRLEHRRRRVAEAEHAVAAGVVQHRTLEGHHPRPARGERDVGIDRILGIEIDVAGLHGLDLRVFVEVEQLRELRLGARIFVHGRIDRGLELRMPGCEFQRRGVVQAGGAAFAGVAAQRGELVDEGHGGTNLRAMGEDVRGGAHSR